MSLRETDVAVGFMPVDLDVERRADGSLIVQSRVPLPAYDPNLARAFAAMAAVRGEATALAWREQGGGWARVSYRSLKSSVDASASWFRERLPAGSPIMIVADNSPAAAVMTLGAITAGMIAAPVSNMHAIVGPPFERLAHVIAKQRPRAVFLGAGAASADAAELSRSSGAITIAEDPDAVGADVRWHDIVSTPRAVDLDEAIDAIDVDAAAQYMLTSGSTGMPKIVPLTSRMMTASVEQGRVVTGTNAGWDRSLVEWLPWTHAAGAGVLRACLLSGGTLHIDAGRPLPGLFETTIRNLREVPVGFSTSVPAGYAMLADALENDPVLRKTFFSDLRMMVYGGAGLPQSISDRLQALALAETGRRVPVTTGYGMTETVTGVMAIHWPETKVGLGLPMPGTTLKLVPDGERFEVRFKGPTVMQGYLDDPVRNEEAFDEDGFYRTGDLAQLHDPADVSCGLRFAGRQAEEFKLANGNWVPGGMLREKLLKSLVGLVRELVLADDGRPYLALMVWAEEGASIEDIAARISRFNADVRWATCRIERVTLLTDPPSMLHHELSEKGTVNRRAVLDRRRDTLDRLFAEVPDFSVARVP
jgi:feruloyl-CoA synthase